MKQLLEKRTNPDQQIQYPYLRGYVHFFLKEYGAAVAALRRADQSDPFILVLLAASYEKLGNQSRAREYDRKALASTSHAVNNAFARWIVRQRGREAAPVADRKTATPEGRGPTRRGR